jgi:hypothetical protein
MPLQYSGFAAGHTPPPPPAKNGGLYTGESFAPGAPYRNFPAQPDASFLVQANLMSAGPPPGATTQPPGTIRPGNNDFDYPLPLKQYSKNHNLFCAPLSVGPCSRR